MIVIHFILPKALVHATKSVTKPEKKTIHDTKTNKQTKNYLLTTQAWCNIDLFVNGKIFIYQDGNRSAVLMRLVFRDSRLVF